MQEFDAKKPRGRSAIHAAHQGVNTQDESMLDLTISDLYGVDRDEAMDIHLNYHLDRIITAIARRCSEKGMTTTTITDRIRYLDLSASANQVAKGKVSEAAAIDALFRSIQLIDNQHGNDRYINFYG
ncbi:MAG: hypothetical protein M3270_06760 [Thermoproteota archaeon]|nr:hypothetical protein [Thermoproteota archaeon]